MKFAPNKHAVGQGYSAPLMLGTRRTIRFMKSFFIVLLFVVVGCEQKKTYGDRNESPESSFFIARSALHNRDLEKYFDSLTYNAVLQTLSNSIAICSFSKLQQIQDSGYNESTGCDSILEKYGWEEPGIKNPDEIIKAREEALRQIDEPRKMVVELEQNHRHMGAGSSFVWNYLDDVEIIDTKIKGNSAESVAKWNGEDHIFKFQLDETGWRFDTNLE